MPFEYCLVAEKLAAVFALVETVVVVLLVNGQVGRTVCFPAAYFTESIHCCQLT